MTYEEMRCDECGGPLVFREISLKKDGRFTGQVRCDKCGSPVYMPPGTKFSVYVSIDKKEFEYEG